MSTDTRRYDDRGTTLTEDDRREFEDRMAWLERNGCGSTAREARRKFGLPEEPERSEIDELEELLAPADNFLEELADIERADAGHRPRTRRRGRTSPTAGRPGRSASRYG